MKKHEIDTLKEQLKNEKKVINSIKAVYKDALENINQKTESFYLQMLKIQLNVDDSVDLTPEKIAEMKSQMQSKIYQAQYQEQLKAQLEEGMKIIESGSYERIHAYLNNCYEDGFIGAMYSMHNQGVPLIIPIDASAVRKAVLLDSKISKGLYSKIVKDVNDLKRRIASEVSRGVAQAMPYAEIARNINNTSRIGLNKAFRIAKTEGHRITQASAYDAMKSAKEKGADVVKQWDATLDGKTRDSHRKLDGQIRELDEPFEVNGHEAMFPADFGRPEEDINCRCVCLQRARWALDDDELETLKERAAFHGLQVKDSKEFGHAKAKDFADFKKKYLNITKDLEKNGKSVTMKLLADINKMITPYEKKVLDAIPKKEGYFDFAAHGASDKIEYGEKGRMMSAREVARIIRHTESYKGENIRLLSCSTGSSDDGFAQQLANALGVEVEAPSDVLVVAPNGTYKIGYDGSGKMLKFKPKGRK